MININNFKKIYFVGIGGIGISALAYYFLKKGVQVSGSDLVRSSITDRLGSEGAKIKIGPHASSHVPRFSDIVVHTPAVNHTNPEILRAKSLKIPVFSYPELLGELTKKYYTIAVSGTHGKSTTTTLIGLLLEAAGLDPTVIVGTKVKEFGDLNCRIGSSNFFVIEADEFAGSFLHYWPKIAVLTNIEKDHMDYFKTMENVFRKFRGYIGHVLKTDGVLVANKDAYLSSQLYKKVVDSFLKNGGKCDFYSQKMLGNHDFPTKTELTDILQIPGEHNISNACAALKTAEILGIKDYPIRQAWGNFHGAWRRFEILNIRRFHADQNAELTPKKYQRKIGVAISVQSADSVFISDYAHHPTEIRATLAAAREKFGKNREIICFYQPHQYQRTYYLFNDFTSAFDLSDTLYLLDIYDVAGRENRKIKGEVSAERLAEAIHTHISKKDSKKTVKGENFLKEVKYISSMSQAFNLIKNQYRKGRFVVFIMGAGDIVNLADLIKKEL